MPDSGEARSEMSDSHRLYVALRDPLTEAQLADVVGFLAETYDVVFPEAFDEVASVRSAAEITRPAHYVAELVDGCGWIEVPLSRDARVRLRYSVAGEEATGILRDPGLSLSIADRYFYALDGESEAEAVARVDELYELLVDLYEFIVAADRPPVYAYGLTGEDELRLSDPEFGVALDRARIDDDRMPGLFWSQIVPPDVVRTVGEDRLLYALVYRAETLSDGAVLLVLHRYPVEEIHEEPVADHLGVPYDAPY